jgi:hypothetical protein
LSFVFCWVFVFLWVFCRSEEALACFFADPDVRGLNTTPIDLPTTCKRK